MNVEPGRSAEDIDRIVFPSGETKVEISSPHLLPRQLLRAVQPLDCDYSRAMSRDPIQIIRLSGSQIAALVPCYAIVRKMRAFYARSARDEFVLASFPYYSTEGGFASATGVHGSMTWSEEWSLLIITSGTDVCPSGAIRHTYALKPPIAEGFPFALKLIELTEQSCDAYPEAPWRVLWEAQAWPRLQAR